MSRLYVVFTCLTVAIVGLLVLLKVDGLSSKVVVVLGFVTLGVTALTFRSALQKQEAKSREHKIFEWCGGLSFLGLLILHFMLDVPK